MFDIGIEKFALLLVLALIIFGPDQLPRVARQTGQTLRQLRRLAADATNDLKEGLGPEYADLDLADLSPRRFIQKHVIEDLDGSREAGRRDVDGGLRGGGHAPYDTEAT
ncbi:sec-independent translocase [Actinoallomurus soli]|uniref:sec-independent translocase n=1 Tax=Actinoallomurus soli TaxID=2952535 RepID=UPI00209236AC|nr:sec-independent translocase [Actinoallomurus soli]MCO5973584.1 sec-independent translocase [Actinoallomurus soli]